MGNCDSYAVEGSREDAVRRPRRLFAHRVGPERIGLPSIEKEARMAFARVVTFEGVDKDRIQQLKREIEQGERPEGLPATEMMVLHDADAQKSLAIVFFDNEEDYKQGDQTLSAMPAGDTPGRRTAVDKYEVAVRATA